MSKIPLQSENPKGFHQRYAIKKLVPSICAKGTILEATVFGEEPVDPDAEYFVMRLDEGGSDREHIKACRIGINAYADAIEKYMPELARDLRERYPLFKEDTQGDVGSGYLGF